MPKIHVEGRDTFAVAAGSKLVLALEDNGVDILHRCGGNLKCTSCRVEILAGEVPPMSEAELNKLTEKGHPTDGSVRLSCQIRVEHDLTVRPILTVASAGMDAGPRPQD
ncbi:MAG TPA: 2Fe-2S iron-sulfur cluster-binding protein [Symbiobacteriaceae bacterium]|nr:2Fe-2S iron-sulfur cluster-binding protein [Symbiobacteriaceae bacterium]